MRIDSPTRPTTSYSASSHLAANRIVAIGASTGGTEAILDILQALPENFPGIVITQHMPKGFTGMYAKRLNKICKLEVREAKFGDIIRPGLALIAPGGDLQTKVVRSNNQYMTHCYYGDRVNGHRPSVDVLFHSVAQHAGPNAVGVILTGMGHDGAEGLLAMKKAGAYTIGQDKATCVVYGMPMVAAHIGATTRQLPLNFIANDLMNHFSKV